MGDLFRGNLASDGGKPAWFDGNPDTYAPCLAGTEAIWQVNTSVVVARFYVRTHYGRNPPDPFGAAGPLDISGGPAAIGPWTVLAVDPDPVGSFVFPSAVDIERTYVVAVPQSFAFYRFRSTGASNNDVLTLEGQDGRLGFPDGLGGML